MREKWENFKADLDDWWHTVRPLSALVRVSIFALGIYLIVAAFFPPNLLLGMLGAVIYGATMVDIVLLMMTMVYNWQETGSIWDD